MAFIFADIAKKHQEYRILFTVSSVSRHHFIPEGFSHSDSTRRARVGDRQEKFVLSKCFAYPGGAKNSETVP